ncbi:MAG TPA: T9SS type A sorting domain-containing protein, partial [Bacteroidales bacterium]|nr:T9SS type A sorting domain-containing protein [Bacteroidales bacterium]
LSLEGSQIRLYNITGRLMGTYVAPVPKEATFDFSHLKSGIYILELQIGDLTTRRKIIIAK